MEKEERYAQIVCPNCGKTLPVRILHLEGVLRYSIKCKDCKKESIVEIKRNI